jgi:hypothetical protein
MASSGAARDLLNGSIVGATIRVHCWREPFDAVPKERDAQVEWLYQH